MLKTGPKEVQAWLGVTGDLLGIVQLNFDHANKWYMH